MRRREIDTKFSELVLSGQSFRELFSHFDYLEGFGPFKQCTLSDEESLSGPFSKLFLNGGTIFEILFLIGGTFCQFLQIFMIPHHDVQPWGIRLHPGHPMALERTDTQVRLCSLTSIGLTNGIKSSYVHLDGANYDVTQLEWCTY